MEEVEVLRERAYSFLRNARRLYEEGEYDIAAFCIEQFCQLFLKYKLLVKVGAYPRTHSLMRLLRELDSAAPGGGLSSFIDSELTSITRVEDAYIVSRYFPRRYERGEVEKLLAFAEKFEEAIKDV